MPAAAVGRGRRTIRRSPGRLVADLGVPVAIRFGEMVLQFVFVALMTSSGSVWSRFSIWDAQLYAQIAHHGYPAAIRSDGRGGLAEGGDFAFSPLYPMIVRVTAWASPMGVLHAALVVSVLAGCALSVCVHSLALAAGYGRRAGYLACALVGVLPMAVTLQMGYAEALCVALSAGAMLAAAHGRWGPSAVLAFLAGLTRPTGFVVAGALLVIAARRRRSAGTGVGESVTSALAVAAAPIGIMVWWAYVAFATGRITGWFQVQRLGWGTRFDGGASFAQFLWGVVRHPATDGVVSMATALVLLMGLAVIVTVASSRSYLPYLMVAVLTYATTAMSTNYWHSRPRLLLVAAVVVVPLGHLAAGVRLSRLLPWLTLGLIASCWYGAYMITTWPYAI